MKNLTLLLSLLILSMSSTLALAKGDQNAPKIGINLMPTSTMTQDKIEDQKAPICACDNQNKS